MIISQDPPSDTQVSPDYEELAARDFARRRLSHGTALWTEADESRLKMRLPEDSLYADAFRRVEQSWIAVGQHETSPELLTLREQAIARARRANARRWLGSGTEEARLWRLAASIVAVSIALIAAYQFAPFGFRPGEYRTNIAEQRVIELEDHSRIALDAVTQLRVRFSNDVRIVQLVHGQAQFSVAKDPARPFKVEAGRNAIVVIGTVFTVEYLDREMRVATLEGKVAVVPLPSLSAREDGTGSTQPRPVAQMAVTPEEKPIGVAHDIELVAGEEVRVRNNGESTVTTNADLEAATAWREGKVIFHKESLANAVRRLNRYSRLQIEIVDEALASMQVNGVFEAGDAPAFVEALQLYLPVTVASSDSGTIRLRMR